MDQNGHGLPLTCLLALLIKQTRLQAHLGYDHEVVIMAHPSIISLLDLINRSSCWRVYHDLRG
jgi:hypothetical protein